MPYTQSNISSLFDSIAPKYDKLNHIMTFGIDKIWRKNAVREIVNVDGFLEVLDVAVGTGDFLVQIVEKNASCGKFVGIDISENMLQIARGKLPLEVELKIADAAALDFDDESFDRVSVAFGVRNFANLSKGLSEMCRVLRPGGRLVILELSYPKTPFLFACYKFYAFHFLPFIGELISGNSEAYTYLPDSILKFPQEEKFIPMLYEAGFSTVKTKRFTFGVCTMYVASK